MDIYQVESLFGLSPREIARKVHAGQIYGENQDYFDAHLVPVAKNAIQIARVHGIAREKYKRIINTAFLHDAPEDTAINGDIITFLFDDEKLGRDSETLNKNHLDGTRKTKDEYYQGISDDIITKVVKTADRYLNISTIPDSPEGRVIPLYNKYKEDLAYYEKYGIFPQIICEVLYRTEITLKSQGWNMKKFS